MYSASFKIDSCYCAYTTASNEENLRLFGGHDDNSLFDGADVGFDETLRYVA